MDAYIIVGCMPEAFKISEPSAKAIKNPLHLSVPNDTKARRYYQPKSCLTSAQVIIEEHAQEIKIAI